MNKRIFELAKQADLIQWDSLPSGARTPDHESVVKAQKFAELIVQDLIDSMIKRYGDDDELPIQEIKLFVKEHFGVEE